MNYVFIRQQTQQNCYCILSFCFKKLAGTSGILSLILIIANKTMYPSIFQKNTTFSMCSNQSRIKMSANDI